PGPAQRRDLQGVAQSRRRRPRPPQGGRRDLASLRLGRQAAGAHGLLEGRVVGFVLIGVGDGEVRDGLVEATALAEIPRDAGRVARTRVGAGEGPGTEAGVLDQVRSRHQVEVDGSLHVAELTHVVGPSVLAARPAEEDVARGLYHALPEDDTLTGVGE